MQKDISSWTEQLESYLQIFRPCVVRQDTFNNIQNYVQGLLLEADRKNTWQMAEALGQKRPDSLQRLLYIAVWESQLLNQTLGKLVTQWFDCSEAVMVLDETGFIKKGVKSAGVQRQYTGTSGKIDNCQIGVFAALAFPDNHLLIDKRLYLPQDWCLDVDRRKAARIPDSIEFKTKPELARDIVQSNLDLDLRPKWVTGDEVYGRASSLRDFLRRSNLNFVLAVPSTLKIWTDDDPNLGESLSCKEFVNLWPEDSWQKIPSLKGEKGPLNYHWSMRRVFENNGKDVGKPIYLLVRRSGSELSYYFCHCPEGTELEELGRVVSSRAKIEQCFKECKQETGLDDYEVRFWHSWHRHITLSMIAYAFLARLKQTSQRKIFVTRPSQG